MANIVYIVEHKDSGFECRLEIDSNNIDKAIRYAKKVWGDKKPHGLNGAELVAHATALDIIRVESQFDEDLGVEGINGIFEYHNDFYLDGRDGVKLLELKQGFSFEELKLEVVMEAVIDE